MMAFFGISILFYFILFFFVRNHNLVGVCQKLLENEYMELFDNNYKKKFKKKRKEQRTREKKKNKPSFER